MRLRATKTFLILVSLAVLASGVWAQQSASLTTAPTDKPNPEQAFMIKAAMGGMLEVQLGELAVQNASNPDVKKFGQRMADDHSKAGDELKSLAETKNVMLPAELGPKEKAMLDRFAKLSGADFDREYMEDMVKDHDKDVAMFENEARGAKDPDVKAWVEKTLPTLKEHQKMAHDIAAKVSGKKSM
jgi:putative membrane protein